MKNKYAFVFVFIFSSFSFCQNYNWQRHDSLVTAGINQIYGIQFEQAEKTFAIVQAEFPKHPSGKFFDAMIDWWKILIDLENESLDDQFYDKLDEVIDLCDDIIDRNSKNVDAIFFKGGALGFRGRLEAIRESWFKAALDGKDGMSLVYKAYEIDPKRVDVQLGFGIYNYYAEVIPQKYPVVKPFMTFFPGGDKKKGLQQLENVAYNGRYTKIEARYFLMTLYFQLENDFINAKKWAEILLKDFPDNPTFQRYYGVIFIKQNDYETAKKNFNDILEKCDAGKKGYNKRARREAYYYIGDYYKLKNNPDAARGYYEQCEKISHEIDKDGESGFLINTVLYLGMIYDQLGMRQKAVEYYNKTLDLKERGESHSLAEKYLQTPFQK